MATTTHPTNVTGWVSWIILAGVLMGISGVVHIIYGMGALFNQGWYLTTTGTLVLLDSAGWGWTMIGVGTLLILTAALLMAGNLFGRIVGALLAIISIVANLSLFSATPVWSTIAIVLDVLILYAIIAHGSEMKQMDSTV